MARGAESLHLECDGRYRSAAAQGRRRRRGPWGAGVWFEEFGRDADAEEAYVTELGASTIYVGILNELYGRLNPPDGFSATETEFRRARDLGMRVAVFAAGEAPRREGHLSRFIERVRFFITTENYADTDDLVRRVVRRLHELAAEALSPWVKLDEIVMRAEHIDDTGQSLAIRARVSNEIAHRLEDARDRRFGSTRHRLIHRDRVVEGISPASAASPTRAVPTRSRSSSRGSGESREARYAPARVVAQPTTSSSWACAPCSLARRCPSRSARSTS